jgi:hypothetical protein
MNSVFHRHGRVFFAVITVVIIISFLGFMTPAFRSLFVAEGHASAAGTIFGQEITYGDLQTQARLDALAASVQMGWPLNNPTLYEQAQNGAFMSMAMCRAAQMRGVRISDKQIADYIAMLPKFKGKNGEFDIEKYNEFIKGDLKKAGYSALELDEAIRNALLLQKLNVQIMNNVIVTPSELKAYYDFSFAKIDVRVARFNYSDFAGKVKVTPEQLEAYFNMNADKYMIVPEFKVQLVKFSYDKYMKQAESKATPEAVKKFYEANKAMFKTPEGKDQLFSKVKAQVEAVLVKELARDAALAAAQSFASELYDEIGEAEDAEKVAVFNERIGQLKLESFKSDWFKADGGKIGNIENPVLIKQITLIEEQLPVSNAVAGKDAAYVAYLLEKHPARKATLAEVKTQVEAELVQVQAVKLARETARNIALKITKSSDRAKLISAKAFGFKKEDTFTRKNAPYGVDGTMILQLSEGVRVGDISAATDTPYGAIIVYVEKRTVPSEKDFEKSKQQVTYYYQNEKIMAARGTLTSWLSGQCKSKGVR